MIIGKFLALLTTIILTILLSYLGIVLIINFNPILRFIGLILVSLNIYLIKKYKKVLR